FKISEGERVLVVDDVLNSGRLCAEAISLARGYGAKVIGVVAIVDRSTGDLPLNVPVRGLISYPLQLFPPDNCPLCRQKLPLTIPGSTVHRVHGHE
ncbi:MAG: phosphoribosyltransferase family protein, partial [Elusimicrobia bacterium]|nr:phosphoribosyltransferase family protein [Elusimicrobiota bacterium]